MIYYNVSLIILFILVIALYTLILNKKFLFNILNFFNRNENSDQVHEPSTISVEKTKNFEEKLSRIKEKLNEKKVECNNLTSSSGDNRIHSLIDNIATFLGQITLANTYILEIIDSKTDNLVTGVTSNADDRKALELIAQLEGINSFLFIFTEMSNYHINEVKDIYKNSISEINLELNKFRKLKDILSNASTIDIYQIEKKQHVTSYVIYLVLFFLFIILGLAFAYFSIGLKSEIIGAHKENLIDYWVLKASGVFIFITLISFFLKQAIHHQKRKEQVEKTMLELKALPSYMAELSSEDAKKLRNDLASKYFGNSNDNSTINEISGLLTEQLKNSTELAKTSVEALKVSKT